MKRSAIAAVGLSLAVLAGCGQTSEPSPPPTSEAALSTPSDDSEVTSEAPTTEAVTEEPEADGPPEMPEEAMEQTEAGAEAFVEYYVDAFNYAYWTGDPTIVAPLNGEDCKSCAALEGLLTGPSDVTEYLTLKSPRVVLLGDSARVEAPLTQASTGTADAQQGTAVFDLAWLSGAWRIAEITVQEDAS